MTRIHIKILCAFALCISFFHPKITFAQEQYVFESDEQFIEFLIDQGEINGLRSFVVFDPTTEIPEDVAPFLDTANGEIRSKIFSSYDSTQAILRGLNLENVVESVRFIVYTDTTDLATAQDFVINLLNSELLFPSVQNQGKDLVRLASRSQYQPLFTEGFGYFTSFKVFLITLIITLFFVMAVSMISFMLIYKSSRNKREKQRKSYEAQISQPLSEILFEKELGEIQNLSPEDLEHFFPTPLRRRQLYREVLIEQIIRLNKKLKGDFKAKLKALYAVLNLDKTTQKLLSRRKWDSKVSALVQINEMDLAQFLPQVKKLVNSPNFYIRTQAGATLLNLSQDVDLSFLKEQDYPLSDWQQMNLLRTIKYLYPERKLKMIELFDSKNKSVRLFGIKLVRYLGKVDLLAKLIDLAHVASVEEQIEVIKTFKSLGAPLDNDLIMKFLNSTDYKLSRVMADAIGTVGDENCIPLVIDSLSETEDFDLRKALLTSLQQLDRAAFDAYCEDTMNYDVQRIRTHLNDKVLSHV
ncbi:HEAT repeat domain-containing protein [Algoriphagus namhaensis]